MRDVIIEMSENLTVRSSIFYQVRFFKHSALEMKQKRTRAFEIEKRIKTSVESAVEKKAELLGGKWLK